MGRRASSRRTARLRASLSNNRTANHSRVSSRGVSRLARPSRGSSSRRTANHSRDSPVEHLVQHGHKKITCIAANSHLLTIKERITGYKEAMRRAKLPCPKELRLSSPALVRSALKELFASRNRPEALFTANNASTIWVIEALQELDLEMGRDVALVGFDDVSFFTLITPPVTAVRQPAAELGSMSARLLLQRIKGEFKASSVRTVLPVTLTIRESCGCKKTDRLYPGSD